MDLETFYLCFLSDKSSKIFSEEDILNMISKADELLERFPQEVIDRMEPFTYIQA